MVTVTKGFDNHTMSLLPEILSEAVASFGKTAFGFGSRLNPLYLLAMLPLAFFFYRRRAVETPFLSWLFPREIYANASCKTDLKLFLFGVLMRVAGFTKVSIIKIAIIYYITQSFGRASAEPGFIGIIILTLILTIAIDFCTYWIHRGHHEIKLIWPFHAVHHSAEVMTPLTVYRKHPVYSLLGNIFRACVMGVVQGAIYCLLFGQISLLTISGVTIAIMAFNVLGSNFRHSHIWISYGPKWSHIFISPAQHQIHHSLAHKHWHKNYGEIFAIWDWMFGTLYVPLKDENLEFGLSTPDGLRIAQPHPTATDALITPFRDVAAYLSRDRDIIFDDKSS